VSHGRELGKVSRGYWRLASISRKKIRLQQIAGIYGTNLTEAGSRMFSFLTVVMSRPLIFRQARSPQTPARGRILSLSPTTTPGGRPVSQPGRVSPVGPERQSQGGQTTHTAVSSLTKVMPMGQAPAMVTRPPAGSRPGPGRAESSRRTATTRLVRLAALRTQTAQLQASFTATTVEGGRPRSPMGRPFAHCLSTMQGKSFPRPTRADRWTELR